MAIPKQKIKTLTAAIGTTVMVKSRFDGASLGSTFEFDVRLMSNSLIKSTRSSSVSKSLSIGLKPADVSGFKRVRVGDCEGDWLNEEEDDDGGMVNVGNRKTGGLIGWWG